MAVTVKTSNLSESNLIVKEWDQTDSRKEVTLKNNTGGALTFKIGQTLVAGTAGDAGTSVPAPAAAADCVLVSCGDGNRESITLAAAASALVGVIRGGPIVINQDGLIFMAGVTAPNAALQRTALDALGIRMIREPLKQGDVADVLT